MRVQVWMVSPPKPGKISDSQGSALTYKMFSVSQVHPCLRWQLGTDPSATGHLQNRTKQVCWKSLSRDLGFQTMRSQSSKEIWVLSLVNIYPENSVLKTLCLAHCCLWHTAPTKDRGHIASQRISMDESHFRNFTQKLISANTDWGLGWNHCSSVFYLIQPHFHPFGQLTFVQPS